MSGVKNKYCPKNEFCKVDMKMDKPLDAVISTGSRLKDVRNALRAAGKPQLCEPSLDALEASGILG